MDELIAKLEAADSAGPIDFTVNAAQLRLRDCFLESLLALGAEVSMALEADGLAPEFAATVVADTCIKYAAAMAMEVRGWIGGEPDHDRWRCVTDRAFLTVLRARHASPASDGEVNG